MWFLILTESNKDCKDMYNILISRKKNAIKAVYKRNGEEFVNRSVLTCLSCWSKLQRNHWLYFDILQKIIATNYYLSKLNLKDTQRCTFCKVKIETNKHLKECSNVTEMECAVVFINV